VYGPTRPKPVRPVIGPDTSQAVHSKSADITDWIRLTYYASTLPLHVGVADLACIFLWIQVTLRKKSVVVTFAADKKARSQVSNQHESESSLYSSWGDTDTNIRGRLLRDTKRRFLPFRRQAFDSFTCKKIKKGPCFLPYLPCSSEGHKLIMGWLPSPSPLAPWCPIRFGRKCPSLNLGGAHLGIRLEAYFSPRQLLSTQHRRLCNTCSCLNKLSNNMLFDFIRYSLKTSSKRHKSWNIVTNLAVLSAMRNTVTVRFGGARLYSSYHMIS